MTASTSADISSVNDDAKSLSLASVSLPPSKMMGKSVVSASEVETESESDFSSDVSSGEIGSLIDQKQEKDVDEEKEAQQKWWKYPIRIVPSVNDKTEGVIVMYDNEMRDDKDELLCGIDKSYFVYNPQGLKESYTTQWSAAFADSCARYMCPPPIEKKAKKEDNNDTNKVGRHVHNHGDKRCFDISIDWSFPIHSIEEKNGNDNDVDVSSFAKLAAKEMVQKCIAQKQREQQQQDGCDGNMNDDYVMENDSSFIEQLEKVISASFQAYGEFCLEHARQQKGSSKQNASEEKHSHSSSCCDHEHCHESRPNALSFKARLIATTGPKGTTCPQWHADYVPARWIQNLVGPGCEYVVVGDEEDEDDVINWDALNHGGLRSLAELNDRNRTLVNPDRATIYKAKVGEGIVMIGRQLDALCDYFSHDSHNHDGDTATTKTVSPLVHKSPSNLSMSQPRVRLTQDVVVDWSHGH